MSAQSDQASAEFDGTPPLGATEVTVMRLAMGIAVEEQAQSWTNL